MSYTFTSPLVSIANNQITIDNELIKFDHLVEKLILILKICVFPVICFLYINRAPKKHSHSIATFFQSSLPVSVLGKKAAISLEASLFNLAIQGLP